MICQSPTGMEIRQLADQPKMIMWVFHLTIKKQIINK